MDTTTSAQQPGFDTADKLGLNREEYEKILEILGREPNFTELSIFSVMWSEHCSYKNSIKYLKTLPRDGGQLLVGAGEENAGLVDIGNGLACAFKIESHNHPSAIEPYQGAATGVGGIHRDIFTMGARPIAALNSLRFGDIALGRTRHLMKGVVSGIGDYGNCLGVPTVGGEVYFDSCYNQNILVNAMSVGVVKIGETVSAISEGPGNPVFIVGSATGKDGIHGATFASADLTEESAEDLPAVQVGDPFQEKLLLEASLEAIKTGALVGMQDMGAAGITCSTSEMSAKGACGMIIDLDKVPTRQPHMQPFEILLSESQERMLIVCHKGREQDLLRVFDKWDLECEEIGVVTDTGLLEFYHRGEKVAEVPAESLVLGGGAPVYDRNYTPPAYLQQIEEFRSRDLPEPEDYVEAAHHLMRSPNLCSRSWVSDQYDGTVRVNSISEHKETDAAIIRLKNQDKALVASTDCNASYVFADPYKGAMIAVSEAARNIIASGGKPLAITNCLNFGNPYNPEVYWQFVNAIKGMGEACRKFNTPVTGGNVSFYNQSVFKDRTEPVHPTPTIGMLGLIGDMSKIQSMSFQQEGDSIYLVGTSRFDLGSSEYIKRQFGVKYSTCPYFDLEEEFQNGKFMQAMIQKGIFQSVHDISEGGLFTALFESCRDKGLGVNISKTVDVRLDGWLFGESQSRYLVSVSEEYVDTFLSEAGSKHISIEKLGLVTGKSMMINGLDYGSIESLQLMHDPVLDHWLEDSI